MDVLRGCRSRFIQASPRINEILDYDTVLRGVLDRGLLADRRSLRETPNNALVGRSGPNTSVHPSQNK